MTGSSLFWRAARAHLAAGHVGNGHPMASIDEPENGSAASDLRIIGMGSEHQNIEGLAHNSKTPWLTANGSAASTSFSAKPVPWETRKGSTFRTLS